MPVNTSRVVLCSILNEVVLFFLTFRWHAGTTVWKNFYLVSVPALQVVSISKVVLSWCLKTEDSDQVSLKFWSTSLIYIYIPLFVQENFGSCLLGHNCVCLTFVGKTKTESVAEFWYEGKPALGLRVHCHLTGRMLQGRTDHGIGVLDGGACGHHHLVHLSLQPCQV